MNTLKKGGSFYTNNEKIGELKKVIRDKDIFNTEKMNLQDIDLVKGIKECEDDLEKRKFIIALENYEFYKPYFYGIMYHYKGFINKDHISNEPIDVLSNSPRSPKLLETEEYILLKFSLVLHNKYEQGIKIKYPILCKFYKRDECLIIFMDMLKDPYQIPRETRDGVETNIYSSLASKIENWLTTNLRITLENFNSFDSTNIFAKDVKVREDLEEFTENSFNSKNGNQKLRADADGKLPFYRELEEVIGSLPCEESITQLNNFLLRYKESSDYYQRGFRWLFENNKNMKVELKKSIFNDGRDLVHFHNHKLTVKEVDYVIRDIITASKLYSETNDFGAESNPEVS